MRINQIHEVICLDNCSLPQFPKKIYLTEINPIYKIKIFDYDFFYIMKMVNFQDNH